MKKQIWLVFEGIDGCGKTTQAKMLDKYFTEHGIKSLYKHVFDSNIGRTIREIFLNNKDLGNIIEILMLCVARCAFLKEMESFFDKYDVIIVDRFYLSILAMQGKTQGDRELINYIRLHMGDIPEPSYLFFIDTSPIECQRRVVERQNGCDRIEKLGLHFHSEVAQRYKVMLKSESNVFVVNGNHDVNTVHSNIVNLVQNIL